MSKAKQLKRNTDSSKHRPILKGGNKRRIGEKKEVNQALLEDVEQRLKQFYSILIHRSIELNPVRDEGHLRELEESYHKESELRAEKQKTTPVFSELRRFTHDRNVRRVLLNNKPWLSKQVDLGLRISKFVKNQNPNLAARTIKDYPEIVFYDDTDIYLCLVLSLNREELKNLLEESKNNPRNSKGILHGNPFRKQILRWEFLTRWGNPQEQKEAKKYLKEAKVGTLIQYLRRGNLLGSGVSKQDVTETYKASLRHFKLLFKDGRTPKYSSDMTIAQMFMNHILQLIALKSFPHPDISYDELEEQFKTAVFVNKLLGQDIMAKPDITGLRKENKKNKGIEISNIRPFSPSNIALHLTAYFYNISPDTVRSHLYR